MTEFEFPDGCRAGQDKTGQWWVTYHAVWLVAVDSDPELPSALIPDGVVDEFLAKAADAAGVPLARWSAVLPPLLLADVRVRVSCPVRDYGVFVRPDGEGVAVKAEYLADVDSHVDLDECFVCQMGDRFGPICFTRESGPVAWLMPVHDVWMAQAAGVETPTRSWAAAS